eukprot:9790612-Lingulodinium_polyedra.AAC.1
MPGGALPKVLVPPVDGQGLVSAGGQSLAPCHLHNVCLEAWVNGPCPFVGSQDGGFSGISTASGQRGQALQDFGQPAPTEGQQL